MVGMGRKKYGAKRAKFSAQGRKRTSLVSKNSNSSAPSYTSNMGLGTHRWANGMIDQTYTKNQ